MNPPRLPVPRMNVPASVAHLRLPPSLPSEPPYYLPSPLSPHARPTPPTTPSTPSTPSADTKRAQNRKSAKRFREAQKLRWAALQAENAAQASEIARLRGLIDGGSRAGAVSIEALTGRGGGETVLAAEARLYARVLASASPVRREGCVGVYAAELGVLVRALCVASGTLLRGEREAWGGSGVFAGIEEGEKAVLDGVLAGRLEGPVAVGYARWGRRVNAVVGPGEDGKAAVVAEFEPIR